MIIIQLVLYLFSVDAIHLFEQGEVWHFNYQTTPTLILSFSSAINRQEEFFIPFVKQFSQVPDVYLNIMQIDLSYFFPQGYSLDITSISTLGFSVKIVCESPERFYGVNFNWFAFDDESVQIINNLNIVYPNSQYTHSYIKNCKINVALATLISFYALGPQFNSLTELSLTTETVTISFYTQNLKQIGYQILLSSYDVFLIGPIITSNEPYGSSQIVNFPQGWDAKNCFSNFLGFQHDGSDSNVRIAQRITYSPQVEVGFYPWDVTIFQQFQYNYFCINNAHFYSAKLDGLIQSNFFETTNSIETHIEIKEINYQQNQNLEEEITIPQGIQSIQIIFFWKCIDNEQLKLQLSCKQVWCPSSFVQCKINKINTIRIQAKFLFQTTQDQYIKITKSSSSLTATQMIKQLQNPFQTVLFKIEQVA